MKKATVCGRSRHCFSMIILECYNIAAGGEAELILWYDGEFMIFHGIFWRDVCTNSCRKRVSKPMASTAEPD